jgi:methyl-accepting chemotaxis protein
MERFLAVSTKENAKTAADQALALEDSLNRIYETSKDQAFLAETDRVIKRLISYDQAFQSLVQLSANRDRSLQRLLETDNRAIAAIVGKVGGEIDGIQGSSAFDARVKLGGLLLVSIALSMAGIAAVAIGGRVFRKAVTEPILRITAAMRQLAEGDLDHRTEFTERGDEIGEMARAIEIFRSNTAEMQRLQSEEAARLAAQQQADRAAREAVERASIESQTAREDAERARHDMLNDLASRFENHVAKAMEAVSDAVREIDEGARRVTSTVAQSRQITTTVADAAVETSTSASTIAAATEEMNLSLSEVSQQVLETSRFAARAVDRVGQTDAIVGILARDAAEIGEVVSMVQSIAQQVNLLALNATIEASRAGEAGRGFAVVASEVKSLAQQTAAATAQIGERVGSIQRISQTAVEAINEIGSVISEMGMLSSSVATAVEQQVHTTAEIARNTTLAATGASQVATNLRRVQEGVATSGDVAETARVAAEEVTRQTDALQKEIDTFLATVRAA